MITIQCTVNAPIEKVWKTWTSPEHITKWNNASEDWHTTSAKNDLSVGGKFNYIMASKDGSMSFDFEGEYTNLVNHSTIEYKLADDRTVKISFFEVENGVLITESFDIESENSEELQKQGWLAILNNYKKYTEQISL